MKKILLLLSLGLSAAALFAGNSQTAYAHHADNAMRSTFAIDMLDTVVFDISQSTMAGNQVSFPVYLVSDDTINALDFSMSFDETNFSLDTIINLTAYLQPTYNYTMGTLYFTSYSLQEIEHEMPLVSIRFNMLGHYLCSDDLSAMLVYLNGEPCSMKVVECLSDGIKNPEVQHAEVHSNAGSGKITVVADDNVTVQLYDLKGCLALPASKIDAEKSSDIDVSGISSGIYMVRISGSDFIHTQKIAISH